MLMGRKSPDFPDDLAQRLSGRVGQRSPPSGSKCGDSGHAQLELADLWQESAAEGEANEWLAAMTGLIDRLNPDIKPAPWPAEDLEKAVGPEQSCAFCHQPIEQDELWAMTLYDASNRLSGGRGLWMHLRCLNARMHHKHAIIDLKFDPDDLPEELAHAWWIALTT